MLSREVDWVEAGEGQSRLASTAPKVSVWRFVVRGGVGAACCRPELFAGDLEAGTLNVMIEHPKAANGLFGLLFSATAIRCWRGGGAGTRGESWL